MKNKDVMNTYIKNTNLSRFNANNETRRLQIRKKNNKRKKEQNKLRNLKRNLKVTSRKINKILAYSFFAFLFGGSPFIEARF